MQEKLFPAITPPKQDANSSILWVIDASTLFTCSLCFFPCDMSQFSLFFLCCAHFFLWPVLSFRCLSLSLVARNVRLGFRVVLLWCERQQLRPTSWFGACGGSRCAPTIVSAIFLTSLRPIQCHNNNRLQIKPTLVPPPRLAPIIQQRKKGSKPTLKLRNWVSSVTSSPLPPCFRFNQRLVQNPKQANFSSCFCSPSFSASNSFFRHTRRPWRVYGFFWVLVCCFLMGSSVSQLPSPKFSPAPRCSHSAWTSLLGRFWDFLGFMGLGLLWRRLMVWCRAVF